MSVKVLASTPNQQSSIEIEVYCSIRKEEWNGFVEGSKNGVFLFNRDYMEYHSDRFIDHSLMFYHNSRLVALMPANLNNDVLYSHGGLTFGGVVSDVSMKTPLMLNVFQALIAHCKGLGVKEVVYKAAPYIYQSVPAGEDLYALFVYNAKLMARSVSSCIYLPRTQKFSSNREDNIRKAKKNGLTVLKSTDFETFMQIEEDTLIEHHGVKPVHTPQELKMLAARFPENIKLFASYKNDVMLAGVVIYESRNVAHMQYAANSKEGRRLGAQDIIEDYLIHDYYRDKPYFDFGISTEKFRQVLNLGLIKRKENFGASAVTYDLYQIVI